MKKYIIAGNWKMNCLPETAKELALEITEFSLGKTSEIIIFPNFLFIPDIKKIISGKNVKLGAQNCSSEIKGAFTGETNAEMLAKSGCEYVICGHSERRSYHNESNETVRKKVKIAHMGGLKTIICVGENLQERQEAKQFELIERQLLESIPECANNENTVIAYEPVWAIGTGITAKSLQISEMHNFITKQTENKFKVIYGGSVKPDNIKEILEIHGVDGVLVGGASIILKEFKAIIDAAENVTN